MFCELLRYVLGINGLRSKSRVFVASPRNASMHRVVIVLGIGGAPLKVFFPPLESDGWANPTGRLQCKNRAYRVPESCLVERLGFSNKVQKFGLGLSAAGVTTAPAPDRVDALLRDDRNHDESCYRVQPKSALRSKPPNRIAER